MKCKICNRNVVFSLDTLYNLTNGCCSDLPCCKGACYGTINDPDTNEILSYELDYECDSCKHHYLDDYLLSECDCGFFIINSSGTVFEDRWNLIKNFIDLRSTRIKKTRIQNKKYNHLKRKRFFISCVDEFLESADVSIK